jgi:hypothetical protein
MKLRRSLLMAGAPVVSVLILAGPAFAAGAGGGATVPPVTVRVEGPARTLLETTTVTAPATGSITKDGTPSGTCPADSAAGALGRATHGDWGGSYYKGLGIDISAILGTKLSYSKGSYWGFYINDRFASAGVCDTTLKQGESLLFAPVPAKGEAPLPIVFKAPQTVHAGRPFAVRTFVYAGKGNATRSVTPSFTSVRGSGSRRLATTSVGATHDGVTHLTLAQSGSVSLVASAKGDIRSAATTIKVVPQR